MTVLDLCERLEILTGRVVRSRRVEEAALSEGREVKRLLVAVLVSGGHLPREGQEPGDCRVVAVGEWAVVMEWDGDGWRGNAFRAAVCGDCEVGP